MVKARPFGTIRKLPSGRFQARYWHLGKQMSAGRSFATAGDARAWLSATETKLNSGKRHNPNSGRIRFAAYAAEWLEHRPLRPRTRLTYQSQLTHILNHFGQAQLKDITTADVRAWHGRLRKSGIHANTVAKIYRLFRTILDTAVEDGHLQSNPVHLKGAAVEHSIERPLLTWAQVAGLAANIEPRFSTFVWLAATSGLRFGELTGLQRRHLDLDAGKVTVNQALVGVDGAEPVFGPPKSTAAHRVVTIPEQTVDLLHRHLAQYVEAGPDALVFTSVKGSPLLNRYFHPFWGRAKTAAEIEAAVRFHDLRHLAGTSTASAGGSLKEIMARMGHNSPDASLRYLKAAERRDQFIATGIEAEIAAQLAEQKAASRVR